MHWIYPNAQGFLCFAVFRSAVSSNQLVILTLIDVVTERLYLIPTRQIQVYEEVFLLNLQVKYSQIC